MKADIITIGDEILIGQITDTNSQFIAEQLNLIGFEIRQISSIADEEKHILSLLDEITPHTDLVLITGGLGPTEDDKTKESLAKYFNAKLVRDDAVLNDVKTFVEGKGFVMNERNCKQAEVPDNCRVIRNKNGTAPGMWFKKNKTVYISMPAVPFEMKEMLLTSVLPLLQRQFHLPEVVHENILTFGYPESELAEILNEWERSLPASVKLAYLPSPERIRLRLSTVSSDRKQSEKILSRAVKTLKNIIGESIFGYGDRYLQDALHDLLIEKKYTVSTAESCTGGKIASLLTSVSGSSAYFKGGLVAYSNEVKRSLLHVPQSVLDTYGAVSKQTVEYMLKGQLDLFGTDYGIAVSGIAGPTGGTADKPVGTTWIAVGNKEKIIAKKYMFGNRRLIAVRLASARAMDNLRRFILGFDF